MSIEIDRSNLGLSTLVLCPPDYRVLSFEPGAISIAREVAVSHTVHGAIDTHTRREQLTSTLEAQVRGASAQALQNNYDALADALLQPLFNVTADIGDTTWEYRCQAADVDPGTMTWRWHDVLPMVEMELTASIPRFPHREDRS